MIPYFVYWVFSFNISMIFFYREARIGDEDMKKFWDSFGAILTTSLLFGWLAWPFFVYASWEPKNLLDIKAEEP